MVNQVDTEATVGQLVAQNPARARVFERVGIDYCCGGKKPLAQACQEKGLDVATIADQLDGDGVVANSQRFADAQAMTLTELADHIVTTHHDYLRRELPRIDFLLAKVVRAHGPRYPEVIEVQRIFAALAEEMTSHMMKEERILFPLIRSIDQNQVDGSHCGSVANPIRQMELEHDSAGEALSQMRQLTSDYATPPDVCNTFRALMDALHDLEEDMHQHVHKENNILFPRAIARETQAA